MREQRLFSSKSIAAAHWWISSFPFLQPSEVEVSEGFLNPIYCYMCYTLFRHCRFTSANAGS